MDISKNYYSILGILPSTEMIVIKAAYKAMLKVYHPDKNLGSEGEAHEKAIEVDEAYRILSNKESKAEYDKLRVESFEDHFSYEQDTNSSVHKQGATYHALDEDWATATKYKSNLIKLEKDLSKISSRLAFTFKVQILASKNFENSSKLANELEHNYLCFYFGTNDTIINFAKKLILDGYIDPARELNQAARVLGKSIDSLQTITKIKRQFELYSENPTVKAEKEARKKVVDRNDKISQEQLVSTLSIMLFMFMAYIIYETWSDNITGLGHLILFFILVIFAWFSISSLKRLKKLNEEDK